MRHGTLFRLLVDQLTDGQLQWCDLHKEYDVVIIGFVTHHWPCSGQSSVGQLLSSAVLVVSPTV